VAPYRPNKLIRTWHDPDAMDLLMNNLGRGGKKSYGKPGRQNDSKERLCYGCGKSGHIARNCRSKAPTGRRMLNVLTRPDAGEEEDWDTCDVVPSIEIDDIRLIDRLRVDYSNLNPSNGPNRRRLDNELTVWVETMSLLDLEDGLT
jgi:hypothetical protein